MGSYVRTSVTKRGGLKRIVTAVACLFWATGCFAACATTTPVDKERKLSDLVVVGTVESQRRVPAQWDSLDGIEYTVHIDQKVKGKHTGNITVFSERSEDGITLENGTRYLLFLNNDDFKHWMVNKCGNSGPVDEESAVIKQMVHLAGND